MGKIAEYRIIMSMNEEILIPVIAKIAQEDWQARHLCLPSLVIAMALHDFPVFFPLRRDGHSGNYQSVEAAVLSHNTYLANWKEKGQERPNWEGLAAQKYYILAVQYLQDAQYPYYPGKKAEAELVEFIERNGLGRYDTVCNIGFSLNLRK